MNIRKVNIATSAKRTGLIVRIAFFASFLILSSKISVSLPFNPVPFTFQLLAVFVIGLLLEPVEAFLAVAIYLLLGAIGLPVFAKGGGVAYILGPTGGFLVGFLLAAPLISLIKGKSGNSLMVILAMLTGLILIYASGLLYLAYLTKKGFLALLYAAVIPFVPFDLIKAIIAFGVFKVYFKSFRNL